MESPRSWTSEASLIDKAIEGAECALVTWDGRQRDEAFKRVRESVRKRKLRTSRGVHSIWFESGGRLLVGYAKKPENLMGIRADWACNAGRTEEERTRIYEAVSSLEILR